MELLAKSSLKKQQRLYLWQQWSSLCIKHFSKSTLERASHWAANWNKQVTQGQHERAAPHRAFTSASSGRRRRLQLIFNPLIKTKDSGAESDSEKKTKGIFLWTSASKSRLPIQLRSLSHTHTESFSHWFTKYKLGRHTACTLKIQAWILGLIAVRSL